MSHLDLHRSFTSLFGVELSHLLVFIFMQLQVTAFTVPQKLEADTLTFALLLRASPHQLLYALLTFFQLEDGNSNMQFVFECAISNKPKLYGSAYVTQELGWDF